MAAIGLYVLTVQRLTAESPQTLVINTVFTLSTKYIVFCSDRICDHLWQHIDLFYIKTPYPYKTPSSIKACATKELKHGVTYSTSGLQLCPYFLKSQKVDVVSLKFSTREKKKK